MVCLTMFLLVAWFLVITAPAQYEVRAIKVEYFTEAQCEKAVAKTMAHHALRAACYKTKDQAI